MPLQQVRALQRHTLANALDGKILVAGNYQIAEGVHVAAIDVENHQLPSILLGKLRRDLRVEVAFRLKVIAEIAPGLG